jgi:hypothetical protein
MEKGISFFLLSPALSVAGGDRREKIEDYGGKA